MNNFNTFLFNYFSRVCLLVFLCNFCYSDLSAQEGLTPITSLPKCLKSTNNKSLQSFDSTFVYIPDTLSLPFLDDFSKNHFQTYDVDFSDPGVTSSKFYSLLDVSTSDPLAFDIEYTTQVTYKRKFDVANGTYEDEFFTPINIQIGDLSIYPVNYVTIQVYPAYYIYDTLDYPNPVDTIHIPSPDIYQDSATQFFHELSDLNAYWLDDDVFHNYHYAIDPWTIGVATFDGIDAEGYPYSIGSSSTGYADYLTSKPINLSTFTAADSIYFSFLFQPKGYGEAPESSDSLVLEFYIEDDQEWERVWSVQGFDSDDFSFGHLPLLNAKYYKPGFQFRFKNYGSLAGGFDHFHLDYVQLREMSGYQDTLFKDFSFVYPLKSLLNDFSSVPWDHYKNNFTGKMNDNVEVVVRNGSNLTENNQDGKVEVFYNSTLEAGGTFPLIAQDLSGGDINYAPRTTYHSFHDFSSGYHFDETKVGDKQTFSVLATAGAPYPNYPQNDSTFSQQVFENYYSYDDGTPEAGYGTTGTQSMLAIRFDPYESDSIIGIMTQFVRTGTDVSNNLFQLIVWDDNNGVPGDTLYQDNAFSPRNPIYEIGFNKFHTYLFRDTLKVPVDGPFYIGWKQYDEERLNIGFDKNTDQSSKSFYSLNGGSTWESSQIAGIAMLRPLFSTEMDVHMGISNANSVDRTVILYPNPTNNLFQIKGSSSNEEFLVFNLQGSVIGETNNQQFDLTNYPNGVYYVKSLLNPSTVLKVIKL
jgi:hypothetical protein